MKSTALGKIIGISILAFGLGILVSFFLPDRVLLFILTILIVALGLLSLLRPRC